MIKEILLWLFIFIVGSLIVNFIINPSDFDSFKDSIKDSLPEIKNNIKEDSKIELNKENFKKINTMTSCALSELVAKNNRMSKEEIKETECKLRCGVISLDYNSFECVKDKLYCYCIN